MSLVTGEAATTVGESSALRRDAIVRLDSQLGAPQ